MPTRLRFRPAGPADIATLQALADRIWRASYAAMLRPAQIDYMLGLMYGGEAIAAEMAGGVSWHLAELDGEAVGFLSLSLGDKVATLHKLYLAPDLQGQGIGQEMLAHAQGLAQRAGAAELRLRVNKANTRALKSYTRAGFTKVGEVVVDIGQGFVMDDDELALPLAPQAAPLVKICGLSTPDTMEAALAAGADQVGLVFFPASPRHVAFERARALAGQARGRADIVALTVDADDALLDAVLAAAAPDWLQLHGRETPERVAAVREGTGRPVMKAVGLSKAADLALAAPYLGVADRILFDAKPPAGAALPGGNGQAFDWTILRDAPPGFMLSGGLSAANIAEALHVSGAAAVDVSSGVETAPGRKDVGRIEAFVKAARHVRGGRDIASTFD